MKWFQGLIVTLGLAIANFGWQYFCASPDYGHAALQSYENAAGIFTFLIIAAL